MSGSVFKTMIPTCFTPILHGLFPFKEMIRWRQDTHNPIRSCFTLLDDVKKLSVYPFLLLSMTILIAKLGFTSVNKFSVRMEKYLSPKNMPWHHRNLMYSFSIYIQLYKNAYKWILENTVALKHIHIRSFITVRFK